MRGALQIGALQELAEESTEQTLSERFSGGIYGYSIGALIATLIAFEFDMSEFSSLTEVLGNMQDALFFLLPKPEEQMMGQRYVS